MTNTDRRLLALNLVLVLFVAGVTPAYAYLDPGSGSMMVQLLLGGVAGAVVIVRLYWARLLTWLGKRDKTDIKTSH
jgi:Na+/proline symporter